MASRAPQIMIVAGEASGDLHGAGLAGELLRLAPAATLCGMGGSEMAAAGVELLLDIAGLSVMGIVEVVGRIREIRAAMWLLEQRLATRPPDLLILIDYPGFNLALAAKAKKLGVPVLYYISPKVWAWGRWRLRRIRRLVDRMAVILPFEKDFYERQGMAVEFVGNPLLDSVKTTMRREVFLARHNIAADCTVVGLLPGSRRQEIRTLLPVFLAAAERLGRNLAKPVFLLPLAPSLTRADLDENGLAASGLDVRVIEGERYDLMAACAAVMAASGTVTLELAILGIPMVVAYRMSPFSYFLVRRLVKLKYASLVNLVAGREVVTELLQEKLSAAGLSAALLLLLEDERAATDMRRQLTEVKGMLGEPGAAGRVAQLAVQMIYGADRQINESD